MEISRILFKPTVQLIEIVNLTPGLLVRGDRKRVAQIIQNILSNAAKFTMNGFVKLKIEEGEVKDGKVELMFSVEDTGIGMSTEIINRVFQPYAQVFLPYLSQ